MKDGHGNEIKIGDCVTFNAKLIQLERLNSQYNETAWCNYLNKNGLTYDTIGKISRMAWGNANVEFSNGHCNEFNVIYLVLCNKGHRHPLTSIFVDENAKKINMNEINSNDKKEIEQNG